MTDYEAIVKVLDSKKPSDVFSDNDWKKDYLRLTQLIHPDVCKHPKASDAMAMLSNYKDLVEKGREFIDESGTFRVFEKKIVYVVNDTNRATITKSYNNYKKIKSSSDLAIKYVQKYIPQDMILEKDKLTIVFMDRSIPLTNQKLEQVHVNWIFSRLFEFSMYMAEIGYSHMGINPTTVFVVPETHGIIVTSFYHLTQLNKKAETVSAKYKMWYPTTLFSKKIATPDIDLELSKKIAIYLLGDRSAAGTKLKIDKSVNQDILSFLLTKHQNKVDEYRQYRTVLDKNFEKKFYALNL